MPPIDPLAITGLDYIARSTRDSMQSTMDAIARSHFAKSSGGMAESVFDHIKEFEAAVDAEHEVGVRLVTFGQAVTFHVQDIGYTQPHMIWFSGILDEGSPARLLQQMSQLSFLLMRLPRHDSEKPRRPIGFHHASASDGSDPAEPALVAVGAP
jgi:hypothetical protein